MEITLLTATGSKVGDFHIAPFLKHPDILTWGYRTFQRIGETSNYKECFAASVPCDYVPMTMRIGDPVEFLDAIAQAIYESPMHKATDPEYPFDKYEDLDKTGKEEYREMAQKAADITVRFFSGEWQMEGDGSMSVRLNGALLR